MGRVMEMEEVQRAFHSGAAAWSALKLTAANGRADLSGMTLVIPTTLQSLDLSSCLLVGSNLALQGDDSIGLDIRGANLAGATINGSCKLTLTVDQGTSLEHAVLSELRLANTNLQAAGLKGATFFKSDLDTVEFGGALDGVTFSRADLRKVVFTDVTLVACPFLSATANQCRFDNAKFADTDRARPSSLEKAAFTSCSFLDADFRRCDLGSAQFIDCDLRRIKGWVVDNTVVRNSLLSAGARDRWSTLRRSYTGANMVFNLIAMVIFFTPFIFQALYWSGFNRVQMEVSKAAAAAEAAVNADPSLQRREAALAALRALAEPRMHECLNSGVVLAEARADPSCLPIWKVLLGFHEKGYWPVLFSCTLLVYNVLRLVLTWLVAPLRDEERGTFHSPSRVRYTWMIYFHWIVSALFYLAISSAIVHLGHSLLMPVWVGLE